MLTLFTKNVTMTVFNNYNFFIQTGKLKKLSNYMAFDFNLLKTFCYQMRRERGKRCKRQFTKHRRRLWRERNILDWGPYLILDKSRWNNGDGYFDMKIEMDIFWFWKHWVSNQLWLNEKLRSVSCIVAKFLLFIKLLPKAFKWLCKTKTGKLSFLIQLHKRCTYHYLFFRKSFVAGCLCSSLNWKVINLVILMQLKGSQLTDFQSIATLFLSSQSWDHFSWLRVGCFF